MYTSQFTNRPLSNQELKTLAPSIFATEPWQGMSSRYKFIPTIDVVEKMRSEGFLPYKAGQSIARTPGKDAYTKHIIRFRDSRDNQVIRANRHVGEIYPELVLTNSHDGLSRYILDVGLWKLACLNGLVVQDKSFSQINVRHSKNAADGVIEASYEVIEQFPKVLGRISEWQETRLTVPQQQAYATAALALRYDEGMNPVGPDAVLRPNRQEDRNNSLWSTFNVVQEHLSRGGDRGWTHTQLPGGNVRSRRATTRPLKSIDQDTRLNKALWSLTEKMAELAKQGGNVS